MQQVGLWWQTGRCTVEDEHLTTEAARAWLENLSSSAPAPARTAPIVLACGPTDLHTIGLEALCVLLRHERLELSAPRCADLRARPGHGRARLLGRGRRDRVPPQHRPGTRGRVHARSRSCGVKVFYAGNAFSAPRTRRNLPGRFLGTRLQEACELIEAELA